ncbi:MAG: acyl-CoA thioesterase [Candidatus Aminicenantes bacterium]|nr:acyl-CoA thioesterase [Candidatus Aminicenantes bacterium]
MNRNNDVFETTFHVRFAETDQMGVVHHAVYAVWFEEGRSQWMRARGRDYAEFDAGGINLAVTELRIRYHRPARYGRRVTVRTCMKSVRSRGMEVSYEVVDSDSGDLLVTGNTRHVSTDRSGRVVRIPDEWVRFLSPER